MRSILDEIVRLRKEAPYTFDRRNSNRYRLVVEEENGSKTAYCFSAPIYHHQTRRLLDLRFHQNADTWSAYGSTTEITAGEDFLLKNSSGFCRLSISGGITVKTEGVVYCHTVEVYPTTNGLAIKAPVLVDETHQMNLFSGLPFLNLRDNDRCFSLMGDKFKPFVTVCAIGTLDQNGRVIAPCRIDYQKINDQEYLLSLTHEAPEGTFILYEVNLYEPKLFQDTTVESKHPKVTNAYGSTAFLGQPAAYGEQWLYLRPDLSKFSDLLNKRIEKAVLHLPNIGGDVVELSAFRLAQRFCSFGSNWSNKISATTPLSDAAVTDRYHSLDITELISDPYSQYIKPTEGLILKTKAKGSGFAAVATSDSCYAPQILEINFS